MASDRLAWAFSSRLVAHLLKYVVIFRLLVPSQGCPLTDAPALVGRWARPPATCELSTAATRRDAPQTAAERAALGLARAGLARLPHTS